MKKGLILTGIILAVFVGIYVLMNITYSNNEIRTRNLTVAQKQVIEANFDKMWKVISQIAQVSDEASTKFTSMYEPLIDGRYGSEKGGALMKWIQEQNPAFDWNLYGKLQTAIEANRTDFFYEQEKLISMKKQHDDMRTTFPSKWFVGDRPEIKITVISSSKTKAVMESGMEENIDLFKKN